MKKIYLAILLNSLIVTLHAQQFNWAKREGLYAYDYGYGISTDQVGNVYIAGKYELQANFSGVIVPDRGNHDIYVAQYSSTGALNWIRTSGGLNGDYAHAFACDGTNYLYVAGEIEGYGNTIVFDSSLITLSPLGDNDAFLSKYDLNGNLLWAISAGGYDNDRAIGVTYDQAGNVYICGHYSNTAYFGSATITGYGGRDIYIAKYDKNGVFQWVQKGGSSGRDEGLGIQCDAAGNVYMCGFYSNGATFSGQTLVAPNNYFEAFLAKYSSSGSLLWIETAGGNYDDLAWSLTIDNAGKIYTTGEFNAYATFDSIGLSTHGQADVFVACYDSLGHIQWVTRGGGNSIDRARGIGTDGSNIYITGQFGSTAAFGSHTVSAADNSDIFIASLNNTGSFRWATSVGGPADSIETLSYESGNAICAEPSGNVYATGALLNGGDFGSTTFQPYSRTDAFLTKLTQGADVIAPIVGVYSPADNSLKVPGNANLVLTFNEPVQKGMGNIIIKESGIGTQTISVSGSNVTISGNKVTIDPPVDFGDSASVNIEMVAGVFQDMPNNNYAGIANATTWNFTIDKKPYVIAYSPADDMINVPNTVNLVLTFNKVVEKGMGNIIIKEGGIGTQTISVTGSNVVVSGNQVTIDPVMDFTDSALVNIEMTAGVFRDSSNNDYMGISNATTWNFSIDKNPLSVTTNKSLKKATIYPNPGNGNFILDTELPQGHRIEMILVDCLGQVVDKRKYKISSKMNIDLSTRKNGIYFIEIRDDGDLHENEIIFREKIIIQ